MVVYGDTLSGIAKRFGVTVNQIVEWNRVELDDPNYIYDPDFIYPGQEFIVGPYRTSIETITDRLAS